MIELQRPSQERPKARGWLARIPKASALAFLGLLFGVAAGELLLRLAGFVEPHLITYDSVRGWALMPGGHGWQREEGNAYVEINRQGFRGPERSLKKPKGVFRVAILGDSFTEAQQVPYEQTFSAVIERELGRCPLLSGRKVEVLNLGVDSYGTAQELLTLSQQALAFSPDVVVVAVFAGNDIRNNSLDLEGDKCRPFFDNRDGTLVPVGPFMQSPTFKFSCMARFLSRYSQVLNLLGEAKSRVREALRRNAVEHAHAGHPDAGGGAAAARAATDGASEQQQATGAAPAKTGLSTPPPERGHHEAGLNDKIYLPVTDRTWERAWSATEGDLNAIARGARAHGARVLVVTLSIAIQVYPDPRVPAAFAHDLGVPDLFAPERRLAAAAERDGYPELNLAPLMAEYAQTHDVFLHGFANTTLGWGHWNALGHRIGGELIAHRICADLRKTPPPPEGQPSKR